MDRQRTRRAGFRRGPVELAIAALATVLIGAPREGEPNPGAEALRADSTRADVYVNESFEAADALSRAARLATAGRWSEAVETLLQLTEAAGDRLVRTEPGRYIGIREVVNEQTCGWPSAGRTVFRNIVDPMLQTRVQALANPRDLDELVALFEGYFCSSFAAKLADTIGPLAIESGNLPLARSVYRKVLDLHPDQAAYRDRYQAMLAVLAAMDGELPEDMGASASGDVRIRWMGQERSVRELLSEVTSTCGALRQTPSASEWPTFAGSIDRDRQATCSVTEPGLLWRVPMAELGATSRIGEDTNAGTRNRMRQMGIQPVVSNGLIFIQVSREVRALHRNTGTEAWQFDPDAMGAGSGRDPDDNPGGAWESVTEHEGRVYASLPGDQGAYYGTDSARRPSELFCLDAEDGRLIWRTGERERLERGTEFQFDSAPLVDHGRVFVTARRRRSFGFEDTYLYSFDAATGALRFRTHLGSASAGAFGSRSTATGIPALHGDAVFVCSNLGAVASVSASTGSVLWLRVYERVASGAPSGSNWPGGERMPWEVNPVIWSKGRIFCQPADSAALLVLAESDGKVLKSLPLDALGGFQQILGVNDHQVCGVGKFAACYDLSTDLVQWSAEILDDDGVVGRGQWADGSLLVPVRTSLRSFRLADGAETRMLWGPDGESGNLLATGDQLVVAGVRGLAAYVRKSDLWRALREKLAAAPGDPLPALELAEVALRAGDVGDALGVLDEAVRRTDAVSDGADPGLRRRIFEAVLAFVDALASQSALDEGRLEILFAYASRYPADPPAHIVYRMRFGALFESRGQPERALVLYQQVLKDRTLRELEHSESEGPAQRAGTAARNRIAALIERFGRTLYAPFEGEAQRWLEGAKAAKDAPALLRVVETFPNSQAAYAALIAQGDLQLESGSPFEAARWYARSYREYPQAGDRAGVLRKTADAYERAGKREQAYRWLSKGVREFPTERILDQGRTLTFSEYRERLADVRSKLEPNRPPLVLPLTSAGDKEFPAPMTLLSPRFADDPSCRWSQVYFAVPGGIRALDATSGTELWARPAEVRSKPELLLVTDKQSVLATLYEIFALDTATGERRWTHGANPERLGNPNVDWEDGEPIRLHAVNGGRLVSVRDSGRMTCLNLDNGELIWSEVHRPVAAGRLRWVDRWIAYDVTQDDRVIVCMVDGTSGQWLGAIPTEEQRAVEQLVLTLDGQAVVATARSVSSYDPQTRALRWRVPVDGRIRRESFHSDLDAVYFCDDGIHLQKIDLEDGRTVWRTDRVFANREDDVQVDACGEQLIVSASSGVVGLDASGGLILWRGTGPKEPRFVTRTVGNPFVVAVDLTPPPGDSKGTAYFYDSRNASGILPKDGVLELGRLLDVQAILVADRSLWIQTASAVHLWSAR